MPSAAWIIDTHRGLDWRLAVGGAFDHVFVAQRAAVAAFERLPVPVTWLPLAVPADLCASVARHHDRRYDVAFVGHPDAGGHRARILGALGRAVTVAPWHRHVEPAEMMRIYRSSRVVVNIPLADDLNMRAFEATGAGALLLTGPLDGLERVLPAGSFEVVPSLDADQWVRSAIDLVADAEATERRAEAARSAVVDAHTYEARACVLTDALEHLQRRPVPPRVRMRGLAAGAVHYKLPATAAALPHLSAKERLGLLAGIADAGAHATRTRLTALPPRKPPGRLPARQGRRARTRS